jgi:uncharacterized protein YndB with AHSA1/START domain
MQLSVRHTIRRPVAQVFALLSDPRQRPNWQASVSRVELLDAGEPRVGQRWRERPHGLVLCSLEIITLEPDRAWAERVDSAIARGVIALRFEAVDPACTELTVDVTLELRGPLKLGAPIARRLLMREIHRDLTRAAQVVSSSHDECASAAKA